MAALAGLILISPVLLVTAIWIKLDSPGPVFYRALRAGRFGRPFRIFKLRTMVVGADKIGGAETPADDPRLTRLGPFLRRYKLDELPQLINVFKGDMSLVGPRPEVLEEVVLYSEEQKRILGVRPGITDWASIKFRDEDEILRGSPDPHRDYHLLIRPEKMRLGLAYVENHGFWTDMKILWTTAKVVLFPPPAGQKEIYEPSSAQPQARH